MPPVNPYVGRFAPTPSGPLHFGSIVAALASFLEAKTRGGLWLIRIEDLDTPRIKPGSVDAILAGLDRLGMVWDREVIYQNQRRESYESALERITASGIIYHCYCSRKQTRGMPYPGTCRNRQRLTDRQSALRVKTDDTETVLFDHVQGKYVQRLLSHSGDFILRRADGVIAYDLATALDDTRDGITDVIRGADLLESTPKQCYLHSLLTRPSPGYGHVPVALADNGKKISKRDGALDALLDKKPHRVLLDVLRFLGQSPITGLEKSDVNTVMAWALENWSLDNVPRVGSITVD